MMIIIFHKRVLLSFAVLRTVSLIFGNLTKNPGVSFA